MRLIGLTGGIASGKSTVARRLRELGAVVVDADAVAREVVEPGTPALARIVETFGPRVIAADGSLDRAALGAIVFADPERRAALNAITHPAVLERSRELFASAGAADPDAVVVYDVPLLAEGARADEFDLIVVTRANPAERLRRMVEHRGMDRAEAERRIAAQASDAERAAIADIVLSTDGSIDETIRRTDELWETLRGS